FLDVDVEHLSGDRCAKRVPEQALVREGDALPRGLGPCLGGRDVDASRTRPKGRELLLEGLAFATDRIALGGELVDASLGDGTARKERLFAEQALVELFLARLDGPNASRCRANLLGATAGTQAIDL